MSRQMSDLPPYGAILPLHVEPSLLCGACGSHGFIRGGVWTDA